MGTPGLPAAPAPTPRLVLAGLLSRHTWPLLRAPPPLAATPAPRRPRSWKFPRRAVSHDPFFSSCVGCAASYRGSREPGRHRRRRQCGRAGRGPGPGWVRGGVGSDPGPHSSSQRHRPTPSFRSCGASRELSGDAPPLGAGRAPQRSRSARFLRVELRKGGLW